VDPDPAPRQKTALSLAERGKQMAERDGFKFLSIKLPHDPALIRGFTEAGFTVAEITAVLEGPVDGREIEDQGRASKATGVVVKASEEEDAAELLTQLGDLFYDGHHLHSQHLPEDFSRRFWRKLAEDGLRNGDPAVFAKDQRQGTAAGFAMAKVSGSEAALTILHVNSEKRGQGLGGLLMRSLLSIIHAKGARTIRTETASWNLPALRAYISQGLTIQAPLIALHWAN
jgi:ribosomal protein S18 acetylase RimI-like enzyme